MFWTAPEILRSMVLCNKGTQKGDVYAFGIIMFEMFYRRQPYDTLLLTPQGKHVDKNRGPYMSAHVLLNLSNQLAKRDKMRGLPSILSLFRNEFNKFNKNKVMNVRLYLIHNIKLPKVSKEANIRKLYSQVQHLTQDTTSESNKNTRGQPFPSRQISYFWHENIKIVSSFTQRYNGFNCVTLRNL